MVLGGNLAYAFKAHGVSWRAAPLGLAVAAFLVAIAIALLIREPKKGRFIVQQVRLPCIRTCCLASLGMACLLRFAPFLGTSATAALARATSLVRKCTLP